MQLSTHTGDFQSFLDAEMAAEAVGLYWLGQAGFALRFDGRLLLIDPYLSDHLAEKYRDAQFPHKRMMQPPVRTEQLDAIDAVLCSHRHSDHMDPGCLPALAAACPACRFVISRAEADPAARLLGLPVSQTDPIDAGNRLQLFGGTIEVAAVPAAHEQPKTNDWGEHHFLGFVLRLGNTTVYHSGDCVVFEGLAEQLRPMNIDMALLPVNGRDEYRTSRGILGNMTFDEAAALCRETHIERMVPHHFGMFDFNTVDPSRLEEQIAELEAGPECVMPPTDGYLVLEE